MQFMLLDDVTVPIIIELAMNIPLKGISMSGKNVE